MEHDAGTKLLRGLVILAVIGGASAVGSYYLFGRAKMPQGGSEQQRVQAIDRLAVQQPSGTAEALAKAAESDPSPEVRRTALAALTHVLKPDHRSVVEKSVQDPDKRVRAVAADTLSVYKDNAAAETLTRVAETDPEEEVQLAALRALARCDAPRALVTLLDLAEKGKTRTVKLTAMMSFMRKKGMRLGEDRDPDKPAAWNDLIQRWKRYQPVQAAYAAVREPLDYRPQEILSDFHPERRVEDFVPPTQPTTQP